MLYFLIKYMKINYENVQFKVVLSFNPLNLNYPRIEEQSYLNELKGGLGPNLKLLSKSCMFHFHPRVHKLVIIIQKSKCNQHVEKVKKYKKCRLTTKNFSYAIFIVKKWPLYVNFSITPCGN
jgi:hypothetical protein